MGLAAYDRDAVLYTARELGHKGAANWIAANWQGSCHGVPNCFVAG